MQRMNHNTVSTSLWNLLDIETSPRVRSYGRFRTMILHITKSAKPFTHPKLTMPKSAKSDCHERKAYRPILLLKTLT